MSSACPFRASRSSSSGDNSWCGSRPGRGTGPSPRIWPTSWATLYAGTGWVWCFCSGHGVQDWVRSRHGARAGRRVRGTRAHGAHRGAGIRRAGARSTRRDRVARGPTRRRARQGGRLARGRDEARVGDRSGAVGSSGLPARPEPVPLAGARFARWRGRAPGILLFPAGCSRSLSLPSAVVPIVLVAATVGAVAVRRVEPGARRDPEIENARPGRSVTRSQPAGAGRLEVEGGAVERERGTTIDQLRIDDRPQIHRGGPRCARCGACRDPEVDGAERPRPIGAEEQFQTVPADGGLSIVGGRVELRYWHGRAKGPVRLECAGVDVVEARASRPVGGEVEGGGLGLLVLEERGLGFVRGRVDAAAEIHRGLPAEVVPLVPPPRDVQVAAAKACPAVTGKEQLAPVKGKGRRGLVVRRVHAGSQAVRWSPGIPDTVPLRHPNVGPADVPRAVEAMKVQAAPVLRDGRARLDVRRVYRRPEVDRGGPVGELGWILGGVSRSEQTWGDWLGGRAGRVVAAARQGEREQQHAVCGCGPHGPSSLKFVAACGWEPWKFPHAALDGPQRDGCYKSPDWIPACSKLRRSVPSARYTRL